MTKPASRASRSTSPKRSGWRGARISSAPGVVALMRANAPQHRRLLAAHRAAGDDHRAVRRHAEEPQHALARLAVRRRRRQLERIELQAAGDRDARRIGAEIDQPPRRLLALHAEAIDVGEHAAEERPDQPVARIRPRRDAAVDHRPSSRRARRHSRSRFGQISVSIMMKSRGFTRLERAADDERPVERKVEDARRRRCRLRRATCCPAIVVVDRNRRRRG